MRLPVFMMVFGGTRGTAVRNVMQSGPRCCQQRSCASPRLQPPFCSRGCRQNNVQMIDDCPSRSTDNSTLTNEKEALSPLHYTAEFFRINRVQKALLCLPGVERHGFLARVLFRPLLATSVPPRDPANRRRKLKKKNLLFSNSLHENEDRANPRVGWSFTGNKEGWTHVALRYGLATGGSFIHGEAVSRRLCCPYPPP